MMGGSMSAEVVALRPATYHAKLREAAPPLSVLFASIIFYVPARGLILAVSNSTPVACLALVLSALAVAAVFSAFSYAELPLPLHILIRGIGGVVLTQVAFDASTLFYAPTSMITGNAGAFFCGGAAVALFAGVLALWRPSFVLPLAAYYVAFRHQFNVAAAISISDTDFLSMLDIVLFATIGAVITISVARSSVSARLWGRAVAPDELKDAAGMLVWACAVGAHLGNYLISGWTKVRAGGAEPLFWLLHNQTQTSILIGLERGDNPLATWPSLVQWTWDGIATAGPALNFLVLAAQLAAPLAMIHRRALMGFALAFDLFHVGVYFTLGALFHFWIVVNTLVFIAARHMRDRAITPLMTITAIVAALFGHLIFYTSHLGWLDGAKLASPSIVAETRDGRQIPVPSVYFGLLSYSIAQTVMYVPEGHFPTRVGGNTYNLSDWEDSRSCGPQTHARQEGGVAWSAVDNRVREIDAAMRRHPLVKSANLYYFYPHHMVANPLLYRDFNRLGVDDIVGYRYVVESVCLRLEDGHLVRDVHKRTERVIHVEN
jgi:hypothetical protein